MCVLGVGLYSQPGGKPCVKAKNGTMVNQKITKKETMRINTFICFTKMCVFD